MHQLKRLIFKEWYRFFFASSFVLFLLITVANLISGFLRGNVTAMEVVFNHFIELPTAFTRIFPISCLIASMFSINKMIRRSELTAIFAAGHSRKAFVFTIFQASLLVGLLQFFTSGYLGPYMKRHRHDLIENSGLKFRNLKSRGLRASTIGSGKLWYKSGDYYFSFVAYDKAKKALIKASLYYFDQSYQMVKNLRAQEVRFIAGNTWEFRNVTSYSKLSERDKFPLFEKIEKISLELNETPADFNQIEADITTLNVQGLKKYISKLKNTGINIDEYYTMYLDKIGSSLICIIFALMASTGLFNPNRRHSSFGKTIFGIFLFTLFYWLIYSYFLELGKNSKMDPYLACFGVPLLFTLFLSGFYYRHRKL